MNARCPSCLADMVVTDGVIGEHHGWGQGGAYAVRCATSGRDYAEMVAWRLSFDDKFEAAS